jgi:NADPH-dependent curcumin reductase CurA
MISPTTKNRQILLASRPSGEPSEENFKLVEAEVPRARSSGKSKSMNFSMIHFGCYSA